MPLHINRRKVLKNSSQSKWKKAFVQQCHIFSLLEPLNLYLFCLEIKEMVKISVCTAVKLVCSDTFGQVCGKVTSLFVEKRVDEGKSGSKNVFVH